MGHVLVHSRPGNHCSPCFGFWAPRQPRYFTKKNEVRQPRTVKASRDCTRQDAAANDLPGGDQITNLRLSGLHSVRRRAGEASSLLQNGNRPATLPPLGVRPSMLALKPPVGWQLAIHPPPAGRRVAVPPDPPLHNIGSKPQP